MIAKWIKFHTAHVSKEIKHYIRSWLHQMEMWQILAILQIFQITNRILTWKWSRDKQSWNYFAEQNSELGLNVRIFIYNRAHFVSNKKLNQLNSLTQLVQQTLELSQWNFYMKLLRKSWGFVRRLSFVLKVTRSKVMTIFIGNFYAIFATIKAYF